MVTTGEITDLMYQLFFMAIKLGGPPLIISMIVGIGISILMAATQIHEQTLTFIPKLVVIGVVLLIMGNSMLKQLQDFTNIVMEMIAR
jgi:flagellar biosynthetic protein FliQ